MPEEPLDAWLTSQIRVGTVEQVHACGVIALAYNRLEDMLITLIDLYFPGDPADEDEDGPGTICARMLNNRNRLDFLKVLVEFQERDDKVKQRVADAISMFEICSENRNILAHGRRDFADYHENIFTLRKMASGSFSKEVYFDIPLADLRTLANEIVRTLDYYFEFCAFLIKDRFGQSNFDDYEPGYQPTLPEKPRIPRKLSPRPRPKDPEGAQSRSQPSDPSRQSDD